MPRYRSLKTGKYVSEHYAKRHLQMTVEEPPSKRRTIKEAAAPPDNITAGQVREAARSVKRSREIKERFRSEGRTFSDSADLIRWDREGVTPEQAAEWVVRPESRATPEAREFAGRFTARAGELLAGR